MLIDFSFKERKKKENKNLFKILIIQPTHYMHKINFFFFSFF